MSDKRVPAFDPFEEPDPPLGELIVGLYAEADLGVVRGGTCGEYVRWQPEPDEQPDWWRDGPCTFAIGHDGEHSRP